MSETETLTHEEIQEIRRKAYADPVFFCQFFLPDMFSKRIPWFHRGIAAILTKQTDFLLEYGEIDKIVKHFVWKEDWDDVNAKEYPLFEPIYDENGGITRIDLLTTKFTELMIPRGFSKTTLAGLALTLRDILYRDREVIVYVSESGTHAEQQLSNVKRELEVNPRIHAVFGNVVPDRNAPQKWTNGIIETTTNIVVMARGRGGQVRGINHMGRRPDKIIVDDLEDAESVATAEQRAKVRSWFYRDLMPALPELNADATLVVLGTLLHSDALMMTLSRDPDWTTVKLGAIDKDGDPLWEAMMSLKKLEGKKQSFILAGELPGYYMEYLSKLSDESSAKFKKSDIIITAPTADIAATAIALDPAISEKNTADFASIAVVSMLTNGKINVRESWGAKGQTPRQLIDKFFELEKLYNCDKHGIESNAYQAALIHIMREEMFRPKPHLQEVGASAQNRYFEIIPIHHAVKKTTRVEGILQARYANKYMEHSRHFPILEAQLIDWPNGKKDAPDALAMAVALLDPYAAQAADEGSDLADDEAEDLDIVMGGDWRSH